MSHNILKILIFYLADDSLSEQVSQAILFLAVAILKYALVMRV